MQEKRPKPQQGVKPPAPPLDPLDGESDIHAADAACTEEDGGCREGLRFVVDHVEAVARIEFFTVDSWWDDLMLESQEGSDGVDGSAGGVAVALHGAWDGDGKLCEFVSENETQGFGFTLI